MSTTRGSFMNPDTEPQSDVAEIVLRMLGKPINFVWSGMDQMILAPSIWGNSYPGAYPGLNIVKNYPDLTLQELVNVIAKTHPQTAWALLVKGKWGQPYNKGNIELVKRMYSPYYYTVLHPVLQIQVPNSHKVDIKDDIEEQFVSSFRDGTPFPTLPILV